MFIPLHVKSDYSLGYGTASIDELVERAASLGYRTLALTDIENLYGQGRFHHQCRLRGIRPLTGVELRPGFDGRRNAGDRRGRLVLLAADTEGYGNLCRIISLRRGAAPGRGPPEAVCGDPLPVASDHPEGLFALSDDPSVIERLLAGGGFHPRSLALLQVRPGEADADKERIGAAARLGVRLVADLDAVFLGASDHTLHALQTAIRQGKPLAEIGEEELESRERLLRSPAETAALFDDLPQTLRAGAEIAEECRFDFEALEVLKPSESIHGIKVLRRLCREALAERPKESPWTSAHGCQLQEELAIFESLGFSDFMLVVAEILDHCRREGIPAVVRGSAVSSLALHLLGASPVDPLAQDLLFERFLHTGKSSWPDVDIDLPWHLRDEVIDWVYRHFGRERTAMVAAHHSFGYRSALREGLKAWGARPSLIRKLIGALPPEDLRAAEPDFLGLSGGTENQGEAVLLDRYGKSAERGEALSLIRRLVGKPRHIAVHPGGVVVCPVPMEGLLPLERAPKGVVITQYDSVSAARLGLVKIDLLGNRCLSELMETFETAGCPGPLRLDSIPPDDPATLALIDRADTLGCFQLESPAMRSLLSRVPIRRQSDLVAALALIRPGAAAGAVKTLFVRRARGEEPAESPFPFMEDRSEGSHGLLLYEEDVIVLLSRAGGLTLGEADELRAAIVESGGEPAILEALGSDFLSRAEIHGAADSELSRLAWETAARFAAYSFNKAHAASFGRLAYLSVYAKAHYPLESACALLNHHQGLYPLRTLAADFVRRGLKLEPPHVNASEYTSCLERKENGRDRDAIRVGLDKVGHLSRRAAAALLKERSSRGLFTTLGNLLERVRLSRREISALVLSGACDGLPPLAARDYPFAHEAAIDLLTRGGAPADLDNLIFPRPAEAESGRTRLYQSLVRVRNELNLLGMHLKDHPMALLRPEAERAGCLPIRAAANSGAGSRLRVAGMAAAMRRVPTRQGPMQFLTLEDETGLLEAAVMPPAFRRLGDRVSTPAPFLVEGDLRREQGAVHLEVSWISPFHERERPFG